MTERPVASMKLENCIRAAICEDNDGKTCGQHEVHPVPNRELLHCGGSYRLNIKGIRKLLIQGKQTTLAEVEA